jgi:hypothetical protein
MWSDSRGELSIHIKNISSVIFWGQGVILCFLQPDFEEKLLFFKVLCMIFNVNAVCRQALICLFLGRTELVAGEVCVRNGLSFSACGIIQTL